MPSNRPGNGPKYRFDPPNGDVTWSSQLQECANCCGFKLSWSPERKQDKGVDIHILTPLINQIPYPKCTASATKVNDAKNKAAELLVNSGALAAWLRR